MRTSPIKAMASTITLALAAAIVFTVSCSKEEGPAGAAGVNGKDGAAGKDGTNGTNGTNGSSVSAADQTAYDAADGTIGARLYDHPLNELLITDTALTNRPDFFRCKSCHGWDLRGKKGVLINKPATATYPEAANGDVYMYAKLHNIREIFDAVKSTGGRYKMASQNSTHPDYGKVLTDAQIWQVVKFLKKEAHNYLDFYDLNTTGIYPTGTKSFSNIGRGGDKVAGKTTYDAKCAGCHGANGTKINVYCKGIYLGDMFRHDPHEIQHKALWGMPLDREYIAKGCADAGLMPQIAITAQDIRNMMVMGQDTVAFPSY